MRGMIGSGLLPGLTSPTKTTMRKLIIQLMVVVTAIALGTNNAHAKKNKNKGDDSNVNGSITAVDATAKTVTVKTSTGDQTVTVDSSVVISKDGQAAKFEDMKPGVNALIGTTKSGDKLSAVSVKISDSPIDDPSPKKKKKKKKDPAA